MKIHEYQAKEIFRDFDVRVPNGKPVFSVEEALQAYDEMGSETVVVKAQIHAGGRGKGGGCGKEKEERRTSYEDYPTFTDKG